MRLNRLFGSLLAFALAVGPFGTATVNAQTAPSEPVPVPSSAPATTASIQGTARDGVGNPLPNAKIVLTGPVRLTGTTDENGRYSFDSVPPGIYSATATKPGYASASSTDVTVLAGAPTPLDVTLVGESLTSLRTIASTSVGNARSSFNTSGLAVTTLGGASIQLRDQPNLVEEIGELPGVSSSGNDGGRTPNSTFDIRGATSLESKTTIDGHVLTNGVFGGYFTQYANSLIFDQVEVLKGAGLNGVNAGEAGVGTVNLRTRDFTAKDSAELQYGTDSFNSQFYQAFVDINLLKDNKLSLLAASVLQGNNGPDYGYHADALNSAGVAANPGAANTGSPLGSALTQWNADFSNTFSTRAQLLKARYRFSQSTSLSLQFLGLQGLFEPQGGSYGYSEGLFTQAQCSNGTGRAATFTGACTAASTYTDPKYFGAVGTTQPTYGFFPNSAIQNNEPQFSAEFRTTYKNDTILVRPYTAVVERYINGTSENLQPGYGGGSAVYPTGSAIPNGTGAPNPGWYQVTNSANCTAQFSYGHSAGGVANADGSSSGPCFTTQNTSTAYIGGKPTFPVLYKTTAATPSCTVATPCYTTPTNQQANGAIGFSTPFSQPEEDRLRGSTFSYLHPVHDNLYTLSLDYNEDDTLRFSGDTSPTSAGCNPTVSSVANTPTLKSGATNPYYQPDCEIGGVILPFTPKTALNIPPTQDRRLDFSGTALLQLLPNLQLGLGGYYSEQRFYYQFTNPAAALAASTAGLAGAEPAQQTLEAGYTFNHHADPHVQLEFRPLTNWSIRANGGSSVTFPYAALVSGFSTLQLNGGSSGTTDTLNTKNPKLQPETFVGYDLGTDYRLPEGTVVSVDLFDNTIHNVFISQTLPISPTFTLPLNFTEQETSTFNGPIERSYGAEMTIQKAPRSGLGYRFDASLDRAYYAGIPYSFYPAAGSKVYSSLINGQQLDGDGLSDITPYFKANAQFTYTPESQHYTVLIGDAFYGNNNGTSGQPYFDAYASYSVKLAPHVSFQASGQNIFNYSSGSSLGEVVANAGFTPVGAEQNGHGGLNYGPAFSTPNSVLVIQPRTIYFSLVSKY